MKTALTMLWEDIILYNNNRFLIILFLVSLVFLWITEKDKKNQADTGLFCNGNHGDLSMSIICMDRNESGRADILSCILVYSGRDSGLL